MKTLNQLSHPGLGTVLEERERIAEISLTPQTQILLLSYLKHTEVIYRPIQNRIQKSADLSLRTKQIDVNKCFKGKSAGSMDGPMKTIRQTNSI